MSSEQLPLQPWLHELSSVVHGHVSALSDSSGDIQPHGAQGLWVDDVRVLSRLGVLVADVPPEPVARQALGSRAEFVLSARTLFPRTPDPVIEVHRTREVTSTGLREHLRLVSRDPEPLSTTVTVLGEVDGVDIAVAKSGLPSPGPVVMAHTTSEAIARTARHEVLVRVTSDGRPSRATATSSGVRFDLEVKLPAAGTAVVEIEVVVHRTAGSHFDADAVEESPGWAELDVRAEDPRLASFVRHSLVDLRSLLMADPQSPGDVFAGAGSPWYLTLFGRDSIWAAYLTLPFGTSLAGGTLRALARRQGAVIDPSRAEEPGKILHEVRRTAYVDPVSGMALPPIYYGTVDATALWVILLVEARRWGMPEQEVEELMPALEAATQWLVEHSMPEADGLLKYLDAAGTGLANQGWKDSGDAIRFADGTIAEGPIALVEAQAYAVRALHGAASLLRAVRRPGAERAEAAARALTDRIRERFWVTGADRRYLGLAIDGQGRLVDGLGSNMGHTLGTGVLSTAESTLVAAALTSDELLDEMGLRTLARSNGGFNPLGYHTGSVWTHDTAIVALGLAVEGHDAAASRLCQALLAAAECFDYRIPELYAGGLLSGRPVPYPAACRPQAWSAAAAAGVVAAALRLRPDSATNTLTVSPLRPQPFGRLHVDGIVFGGGRVAVTVESDGSVTVDRAPAGVRVVVEPPVA